MAGGKVIVINSVSEFSNVVASNSGKVVVIDFAATWCGPCRLIGPYFEQLSTQFDSIVFVKVDVDQVGELAEQFGVSAMPTFAVVRNGDKVDELVGASKDRLRELIAKYA